MRTEIQKDVFIVHVLLIIPQHTEGISLQIDEPVPFRIRKKKKEGVNSNTTWPISAKKCLNSLEKVRKLC